MKVYYHTHLEDINPVPVGSFCILRPGGSVHFYLNGLPHNADGPAIVWSNGDMEYYYNGVYHCETGPAAIYSNGDVEYWYMGKQYSEVKNDDEWIAQVAILKTK